MMNYVSCPLGQGIGTKCSCMKSKIHTQGRKVMGTTAAVVHPVTVLTSARHTAHHRYRGCGTWGHRHATKG